MISTITTIGFSVGVKGEEPAEDSPQSSNTAEDDK